MVIRLGMIGYSEGNGHPYSFSAILNGFSKDILKLKSSWPNIDRYLNMSETTSPLDNRFKVTHINAGSGKSEGLGKEIAKKFDVEYIFKDYRDFFSDVDALIVAHDDPITRIPIEDEIEKSFTGIVFYDKPLTNSASRLKKKLKDMEYGRTWCAAGMRFTRSFDDMVAQIERKKCKFSFTIPNSWEKYGIHVLEFLIQKKIIDLYSSCEFKKNGEKIDVYLIKEHICSINLKKGYQNITMSIDDSGEEVHLTDNFYSFQEMLKIWLNSFSTDGILAVPEKHLQITERSNQLLLRGVI
tara:strand:- start:835 stop:1725 length:891 start_codon:yes stop_codon:yes gene_type:complete